MAVRSSRRQILRHLARRRRRSLAGGDYGLLRTVSWPQSQVATTPFTLEQVTGQITFKVRADLQPGALVFQIGSSVTVQSEADGLHVTLGGRPASIVPAPIGGTAEIAVAIRPADNKLRVWIGSTLAHQEDVTPAFSGGRWADETSESLLVGATLEPLRMYVGQVPAGFSTSFSAADLVAVNWSAWGAAPACAYAAPMIEGAGGVSKNYASESFGELSALAWESDATAPFAEVSLETPVQTLRAPPVGGFWGNKSSIANRGQSTIQVACTGPIGAGGREPYLNLEVGDVAPSQRFHTIYIDPSTLELYFSTLPGVTTHSLRPGITCVAGRRYFVAAHVGYAENAGDWATGHDCEYHVREFDGAVQTNAWDGSGKITQQTDLLSVDGGHVHPTGWWNTNVSTNTSPDPDEGQLMQGYAVFWGGRRDSISDLLQASDHLAPRWATGDMAIWEPWLTLDPLKPAEVVGSGLSSISQIAPSGAAVVTQPSQSEKAASGSASTQQITVTGSASSISPSSEKAASGSASVNAIFPSGDAGVISQRAASGVAGISKPFVNAGSATAEQSDTEDPTIPPNARAAPVDANNVKVAFDSSTDNVGVVAYDIYRDDIKIGEVEP